MSIVESVTNRIILIPPIKYEFNIGSRAAATFCVPWDRVQMSSPVFSEKIFCVFF